MAYTANSRRKRSRAFNDAERARNRQKWGEPYFEVIEDSSPPEVIIDDDEDSLPPRKVVVKEASPADVIIIDDDEDPLPPSKVIVKDASPPEDIIIDDDGDPLPPRKVIVKDASPPEVIIINDDEDSLSICKVKDASPPEDIDKDTSPPREAIVIEDGSGPFHQPGTAPEALALGRQRSTPLAEAITDDDSSRATGHQSETVNVSPFSSPSPACLPAQQVRGERWIVVTGAGISTQDFKSRKGKGLRKLFDAAMLRSPDTAQEYLDKVRDFQEKVNAASPTSTHEFIAELRSTGRLLRTYTQNIDGLEEKAGLPCGPAGSAICVQLHGSVHSLRCSLCLQVSRPSLGDVAPGSECLLCGGRAKERIDAGKRRCASGILLPDIRLYNEEHPDGDLIAEAVRQDLGQQPDVLLIMGTSLRVPGVKWLVRVLGNAVRDNGWKTVLVNRDPPPPPLRGLVEWLAMDCDEWVNRQLRY